MKQSDKNNHCIDLKTLRRKETAMTNRQNKTVYIVFDDFYTNILGVFSSKRALNKQFCMWADEIHKFIKSEKVKVNITKNKTPLGEREICIEHNIPSYNMIILQTEIVNSQKIELSETSKIWISYSYYDPGVVQATLTRKEGSSYLKSIGCLQQNGTPKEGTYFKEHKIQY